MDYLQCAISEKSQERKFTDSEIAHRKIPICDMRSTQNRKSAYYNHRPLPSQVSLFAICDHHAITRSQHHTIAISHFRHMLFPPVVSCNVGPESKIEYYLKNPKVIWIYILLMSQWLVNVYNIIWQRQILGFQIGLA